MKIKLKNSFGETSAGSLVDAAISVTGVAYFYDESGAGWYLTTSDFTIEKKELMTEEKNKFTTLRDFLGQDLSRIEFK